MFELIYIWLALVGVSEAIISLVKRSKDSSRKKNGDRYSLVGLWLLTPVGIACSMTIREIYGPLSYTPSWIPYIGLAISGCGILIRWASIAQLKSAFTVNVSIVHDHQLKTDGFYTYVRHPSYSGLLINFIGIGIAINNFLSAAALLTPLIIALVYRIRIEEKLLEEGFGKQYQEYRKKTKALFPFLI